MAIIVKDRVKTTSTTSGTGAITLSGTPEAGFQSFAVIDSGNQTYYCIKDGGNDAWEVGLGTVSASGTNLTRDTILSSSNSNNALTLTSNTHTVFTTYPASKSSFSDVGLNLPYQVSGDTIASGDPVGLNSDGTVSIIKQTTSYNKTNAQWSSSATSSDYQRGWAFDPETNTAVLCFNDSTNGSYPTAVAGTIDPTNGTVTWGTPAVLKTESNGIPNQICTHMKGSTQTSYPEFLVVIRPQTQYEYYKAGWFHVNGTTITMGSSGSMTWKNFSNSNPVGNGGSVSVAYDRYHNNMICAYQYGHYNSGLQLYGGYLGVQSSGFQASNYGTSQSIGYHSQYNNAFKMVIDDTLQKPVVIYSDKDDSHKLHAERMDWNWTATYSSNYGFDLSTSSERVVSATYDPSSGKILVLSSMVNSPYTTAGSLITWSGNTGQQTKLTTGWNGADSKYASQSWGAQSNGIYQASSSKTYYGFLDPQDANKWKVLVIDTSGTNLSYSKYDTAPAGSYTLASVNNVPYYVKPENSNYDWYMFKTTTNGQSYSGLSQTTTNVDDYFGLALSGAGNGNNIDVNLFGSINNNFTGLTTGSYYYVADNGTIGLQGSAFVGTAISTTEIQITSPAVGSRGEVAGENFNIGQAVGFGHDGRVYKAKNVATGEATIGTVSEFAQIGTNFSDGYYGSGCDYCWDDDYNVMHIFYNDGNYLKHKYATPDGDSWTYSSDTTINSSNPGGVAVAKGKSANGNPMFVIVRTTTSSAYQYGVMTYSGTTSNTFTTKTSFTDINAGNYKNQQGSGTNVKLYWTDTTARTIGSDTYYGNFIMLGTYNGQYYESGECNMRYWYWSGGSNDEYSITGGDVQLAQQSGVFFPAKAGFDMVFSENEYFDGGYYQAYGFVAMRQIGNSGDWGVHKVRSQSNGMGWQSVGFTANASAQSISTGMSLALDERPTASDSRLYVFVTPSDYITCQVYNPNLHSHNSTSSTMNNPINLQTNASWGANRPIVTRYDEDNDVLLCAYGVLEADNDQRMYYGTFTTTPDTSPYISGGSLFSNYYNACNLENAIADVNCLIKKIAKGQYVVFNGSSNTSRGTKKATFTNFNTQMNFGYSSFIGIAQSTVTTGNNVTVKTQGATDGNQTGLVNGSPVYLDSTTGNIATGGESPSATQKQIGVATSTTKVLIQ